MKTITLSKAWDFVTPERTVSFTAGDHDVTDEIAAAAEAAGVTGKEANGKPDKSAKAGAAGAADSSQG